MTISSDTSKRITSLRFILAMMVVFIHFNGGEQYSLCHSSLSLWIMHSCLGLFDASVPLFFLFSGYLQAKKPYPYRVLLKKRALSLLLPFILWTSVYVGIFAWGKPLFFRVFPSLVANPDASAQSYGAMDWFQGVIGGLSVHGALSTPGIAFQLWFLRDLMFFVLLSPIFIFFVRNCAVEFFGLILVFNLSPLPVWFTDIHSLFFYILGLYWGIYDYPLFEKVNERNGWTLLVLFVFFLFMSECFFGGHGPFHWFMILVSCSLCLKCSARLVGEKQFAFWSRMAGYSFFLYMVHAPILEATIQKIWEIMWPVQNDGEVFCEYFGVSMVTVFIGTGLGIVIKRMSPSLFSFLNGGRK